MGEIAVGPLLDYIKDMDKDLFSREDAARALGVIGTNKVVEELGNWLDVAPNEDKAMPLYALGCTGNSNSRAIIEAWMQKNQNHPKFSVAQEALTERVTSSEAKIPDVIKLRTQKEAGDLLESLPGYRMNP